MSTTELELKVTADTSEAIKALNELEQSLRRVQDAVNKASSGNIGTVGESISNAFPAITIERIEGTASAIESLNQAILGMNIAKLTTAAVSMGLFTASMTELLTAYSSGLLTSDTPLSLPVPIGVEPVLEAIPVEYTIDEIGELATQSLLLGLPGEAVSGSAVGTASAAAFGLSDVLLTAGLAVATGLVIYGVTELVMALIPKDNGIQWGNYDATNREIQDYVSTAMFNAEAKVNIELIDGAITLSDTAESNIIKSVAELAIPLNALELGVNVNNSLKKIQEQVFGVDGSGGAGTLIGRFQEYARSQTSTVETAITLIPLKNEQGKDVSGEFLNSAFSGWNMLEEYMEELGKTLNEHLALGMDESLTEELRAYEEKAISEIAQTMARITRAAATAESESGAAMRFQFGLGDLTKDSFDQAMELYNEFMESTKQAYVDIKTEAAASYAGLAAAFQEIADAAEDAETKAFYQERANEYQLIYEDYLHAAKEGVNDALAEQFASGRGMLRDTFAEWLNDESLDSFTISGLITEALSEGNTAEAERMLSESLMNYLKIPQDVLETIGMSVFELLPYDMWEKLAEKLYGNVFDANKVNDFLSNLGYRSSMPSVSNDNGLPQNIADQINNITEAISGGDFGSTLDYAVEEISKLLGLTGDEGVSFSDTVFQMIDNFANSELTLDEFEESLTTFIQNIESSQVGSPDISGFTAGMQSMVDSASAAATNISMILGSLNGLPVTYSGNIRPIRMAASGGQFSSGEMFIANENGAAEMIGSMGNKATVVNNAQIIEGISSGVASGQAEQNALLRQQNEYLRAFLDKEFTAKVVPSAALGKTMRQSAEMYTRNAGV